MISQNLAEIVPGLENLTAPVMVFDRTVCLGMYNQEEVRCFADAGVETAPADVAPLASSRSPVPCWIH